MQCIILGDIPPHSPVVSCVWRQSLIFPQIITRRLFIEYPNTILYVDRLGSQPVDLIRYLFENIPIMPIMTRTYPDDADVNLNSHEGIDTTPTELTN
jgi:hypothetical protein